MKRSIMCVLVALLVSVGVAQSEEADTNAKQSVFGIVDKVNYVDWNLVVNGKQYTFNYETLSVKVKGRESAIMEIKAGDKVTIQYVERSDPKQRIALSITK